MISIPFRPLMTGLLLPAAFLYGCSDAPVNPPSPCASSAAPQATPAPLMPRTGVIKMRAGDRRRFDEATVRLALVSIDAPKGEAVVRLTQKGKPDESRTVRVKQEKIFEGWPVPGRFYFAAIKDGKALWRRPWGNCEHETPLDPKTVQHCLLICADGSEGVGLAPGESWAANGLSGELRVDSVDTDHGTADMRFVFDGGFSDRTFTLRRGYRLDSHGLNLGLRAIGADGELTVERF